MGGAAGVLHVADALPTGHQQPTVGQEGLASGKDVRSGIADVGEPPRGGVPHGRRREAEDLALALVEGGLPLLPGQHLAVGQQRGVHRDHRPLHHRGPRPAAGRVRGRPTAGPGRARRRRSWNGGVCRQGRIRRRRHRRGGGVACCREAAGGLGAAAGRNQAQQPGERRLQAVPVVHACPSRRVNSKLGVATTERTRGTATGSAGRRRCSWSAASSPALAAPGQGSPRAGGPARDRPRG